MRHPVLAPRVLFTALGILFVGFACGSDSELPNGNETVARIVVSGQAEFEDGTAPAGDVSYRLTLDGIDLFRSGGDGCKAMPDHGTGAFSHTVDNPGDPAFELDVPAASIHASVIPTCSLAGLKFEQIRNIRLNVTVPAAPESCALYCASRAEADPDCGSGCEDGQRLLQAQASLAGDELRSTLIASTGGTIRWNPRLTYSSLGPALTSGAGVDLAADAAAPQSTAQVTREYFAPESCEVKEKCLRGTGERTLLRFNSILSNLGTEDLVIGDPAGNPMFSYDTCHHHYHMHDVLLYELVDTESGQAVQVDGQQVVGRKTGFCLMDMLSAVPGTTSKGYTCSNQGISSGWSDEYEASLECQFVDITGVAAGKYVLRITVNPENKLVENDLGNNVTEVPVEIP